MDLQYVPYFATDIETSGLADECEIFEIACVVDDFQSPIKSLKNFDEYILHRNFHGEPVAMHINAGLIAEMAKEVMNKEFKKFKDPKDVAENFVSFLEIQYEKHGKERLVMAGKNPQGFDKPRLDLFMSKYAGANTVKTWHSLWKHRALDIGSMYFDHYGTNVSLSEINKTLGRKEVSHNGLDDCFDIVYAVRNKMGVSCE